MKSDPLSFRKPLRPSKVKRVGLASVKDDPAGVAQCSCGWTYPHQRTKVRENAIQRHLDKKHGGQGLWL